MLKVNTTFCGELIKKAEEVEILERKYFQTKNKVIDVTTDLKYWFKVYVKNVVLNDLSEFEASQSSWALNKIISLEININKFEVAKGASSYIQLHPKVARKRSCISVMNNDQACFAWAIVSALYSVNINTNKTTSYPHYTNVLNLKSLTFPVTLNQLPLFEKSNENISVNVFELNVKDEHFNFSVLPVRLTKQKRERHVNLLIVQNKYYFNNKADSVEPWSDGHDDDIIHFYYIWIKDLGNCLTEPHPIWQATCACQIQTTKIPESNTDSQLAYFNVQQRACENVQQGSNNNYRKYSPTEVRPPDSTIKKLTRLIYKAYQAVSQPYNMICFKCDSFFCYCPETIKLDSDIEEKDEEEHEAEEEERDPKDEILTPSTIPPPKKQKKNKIKILKNFMFVIILHFYNKKIQIIEPLNH
ncbi:unnamed protein product [Diabrotica balteata]|uniref:Uncharacterized protein n=1 Tax=Diabrotica balteata TaxID=107213 RepID=A0A9N9TCF8_DIABA|nr:unnamed protein product [Diabrotica balteata]